MAVSWKGLMRQLHPACADCTCKGTNNFQLFERPSCLRPSNRFAAQTSGSSTFPLLLKVCNSIRTRVLAHQSEIVCTIFRSVLCVNFRSKTISFQLVLRLDWPRDFQNGCQQTPRSGPESFLGALDDEIWEINSSYLILNTNISRIRECLQGHHPAGENPHFANWKEPWLSISVYCSPPLLLPQKSYTSESEVGSR